jgi:hypothetical protein
VKVKIRLDTTTDAISFSQTCDILPGHITITDNKGLRINAKSVLGMLYALEFEELWCESDEDIYMHIKDFIIIE